MKTYQFSGILYSIGEPSHRDYCSVMGIVIRVPEVKDKQGRIREKQRMIPVKIFNKRIVPFQDSNIAVGDMVELEVYINTVPVKHGEIGGWHINFSLKSINLLVL